MKTISTSEAQGNLPHWLGRSTKPVAVTKHGQLIGYIVPRDSVIGELMEAVFRGLDLIELEHYKENQNDE